MRTFCCIFALLAVFTSTAYCEDWAGLAGEVDSALNRAVAGYKEGKTDEAKSLVSRAYFDIFEASGMEKAVSVRISDDRKTEIELMFSGLRGAMAKKMPLDAVVGRKERLIFELGKDVSRLSAGAPYSTLFSSFLIIVREGFEAILIIGALIAYLRKTGNQEKVPEIYRGAAAALVASGFTAIILSSAISVSGKSREAIEGVTMLVATAVLFYVSWWLLSKSGLRRWQGYIKERLDRSLAGGSAFALGFTAFIAVYREGAETVLFYQALSADAGGGAFQIVSGFLAGAAVLTVIFFAIRFFSVRIPQGPFFLVTSLLLYYLAFGFAGKGVKELQEAELVKATYIEGMSAVNFIGLYPTWQGVALQSALIFLFLFALSWSAFMKLRRVAAL